MPTELRRFFQCVLSQYRPKTRLGRRSAFSFGRSSEPLEIRQLLAADLGNLLSPAAVANSTQPQGWAEHDPDDGDPPIGPSTPSADVIGSYLTSPGGGDPQPLSFNDVAQGNAGTCAFDSALSAVARTDQNLGSRITLVSQVGNVSTYHVQLYSLYGQNTYVPNVRTVVWNGTRLAGDLQYGDNKEIWPIIFQRAYLDLATSLGQDYRSTSFALTSLVGSTFDTGYAVDGSLGTAVVLRGWLQNGRPTVVTTPDTASYFANSQYGIVGSHAYTLIGVEIPANHDLSQTYVTVRNPWGYDTSSRFFDTNHNGVDVPEYQNWSYGVDGSNDGMIRLPWTAFSSTFTWMEADGDGGPNVNTPLPTPVHFTTTSLGPFTIYEGQDLQVNIHAVDANGGLVFYSMDPNSEGQINLQSGAYDWEPLDGQAGDYLIRVVADHGPYTTATISFIVHVLPGSPIIGSVTANPTTIHKNGSDLLTLTANNVTSPYGSVDGVDFYVDSNHDGVFESTDLLLGAGTKSGNNYSWSGYAAGLDYDNNKFFAQARRTAHRSVFYTTDYTYVNVIASPFVDPVAIPKTSYQRSVTDITKNETILRELPDGVGGLRVLSIQQSAASTYTYIVRRYDSLGNFIVASTVAETNAANVDIVTDWGGRFGIVWTKTNGSGLSTIFLQWYDSDYGFAETGIYTLAATTATISNLQVAADQIGNMLVVYNTGDYFSEDVWALSSSHFGTVKRAPWLVNTHTANEQKYPTVSLNANGDGVITWTDGDQNRTMARQVSAYGQTNGPEIVVANQGANDTLMASAVTATGEFYVAWTTGTAIQLQKFNAAGQPQGTPVKVNTFSGGYSSQPRIAVSTSGWMAVGWDNSIEDNATHVGDGVYAQVFDDTGAKAGPEFAVPSFNEYSQVLAGVVMDGNADLTFVWTDGGGPSSYSVNTGFLRQFAIDLPLKFNPATTFSIPETSVPGTWVGMVPASDPDPGSTVTYTLQGTAPFVVDSQNGTITVAPGAAFDYGVQSRYPLNVHVTSGSSSVDVQMEIDITDVNIPPDLQLGDQPGGSTYTLRRTPALFVDPMTLTDVDSPVFNGGYLLATSNDTGEDISADRIGLSKTLGVAVSATNDVIVNGVTVGTIVSTGEGLTPFQINLNDQATLSIVQLLLHSLQFQVVGPTSSFYPRTINVTVNDGLADSSLVNRVVYVLDNTTPNAAPQLDNSGTPTLPTLWEDIPPALNTGTQISDLIAAMDPGGISDLDVSDPQGIALRFAPASGGTWQYSSNDGGSWTDVGAVSVNNALLLTSAPGWRLRFKPLANFNGQRTIQFNAWDQTTGTPGTKVDISTNGGTTAFSTALESATVTFTPTNDAPVLHTAGSPKLTDIPEDSFANTGTSVKQLIASGGVGYVTDIDGAQEVQGIAIYAAPNSGGTWQYTLNNGTTWSNIGTVTTTSALTLAADAAETNRIRFVPLANFNGTRQIYFRAWDQTDGVNGAKANLTLSGGVTSISSNSDSATVTVTPVNDAPLLYNAKTPTLGTMNRTAINHPGIKVADLIASAGAGYITDLYDVAPQQGIAIYSVQNTGGKWQYTVNGTTWLDVIPTGNVLDDAHALHLAADSLTRLRFVPNGTSTGDRKIFFRAWDRTNGVANGARADSSLRGGTTAYSVAADSAILTVNTVNDAPVLNAAGSPTLPTISKTNSNPAGISILNLIASGGANYMTDLESTDPQGIAIYGAPNSGGTWEYSLDSGAHWTSVGTVDQSHSLLLKAVASTLIRFKPLATFAGSRQISFSAWDQSAGVEGTKVDTNYDGVTTFNRGGTTAFSIARDTASITIT